MNIGITTIYPHRPIIFFAAYLAKLLRTNGDKVSAMVCDSSLPTCYSMLSKGKGKLAECPICILGGLRSFDIDSYFSIDKNLFAKLNKQEINEIALSSIMTLERAENKDDISNSKILREFEKLEKSVAITYQNTIEWINRDQLDLIICYNGRMDATKAVIKACENLGVNYITLERSIYGYGLQLIPNNNCLSLSDRIRINKIFKKIPLTEKEGKIADWLAETRISQNSHLEWRTYASESKSTAELKFPKILILPSSNCEFIGNSEWETEWGHFTNALDEFLLRSNFQNSEIAIKIHPVWDQYIGQKDGKHIISLYTEWAINNNVQIINTYHPVSTTDLIREAEYIVVGGSSAGIDAALLGKKVILLGHAHYEGAGFFCHIQNNKDWDKLKEIRLTNPEEIKTIAKRYLYSSTFRYNQLSDKVIPLNYFDYIFKKDDLSCIYSMLKTSEITPWKIDLSNFAIGNEIERLGKIVFETNNEDSQILIRRRFLFRFIDYARKLFPRGDQIKEAKK